MERWGVAGHLEVMGGGPWECGGWPPSSWRWEVGHGNYGGVATSRRWEVGHGKVEG